MIIKGVVIHGAELGRKLGFPTANLDATGIDIANGVYFSKVEIDGKRYKAMTNIGIRPSVDGNCRLLEAHIFDYEGTLYDKEIKVELLSKLRDEQRFNSITELQEQLQRDAAKCYSMKE